jgi:hypothetical protein
MSRIVTIALLLLLSGCFGFVHDEVLVGRYRLVAVDGRDQMQMCWSIGDHGDCLGEGLPPAMLFAAGFNEKYVVAAVHPSGPQGPTTWYFYVVRDPLNENNKVWVRHDTKGPFSESEYEAERTRLDLPPFTRIFHDLK